MRRPSPALLVALLALFVALDGPAAAARTINGKLLKKQSVTSRAVKNRTLQVADLSRDARRSLRTVRDGAVTEAKLADGSVGGDKLRAGAVGGTAIADRSVGPDDLAAGGVGGAAIADGSITGAKVADGSLGGADVVDGGLDARDIGRFSGRFRTAVPAIAPGVCWSGVPTGLAPERARADISQDLVVVTPGADWPERQLAFTVSNDGAPDRFVIAACNRTALPVAAFEAGFRYLVIDLP
jgi:hypothetical protein